MSSQARIDRPEGNSPFVQPEMERVEALRSGDERAFVALVESFQPSMLRVARLFVPPDICGEVVQDAWLGVLEGISRFEGRSSLKTWIFRILVNRAKTRAVRERRSIPFSALRHLEDESDEPSVDPDRFRPPGAEYAGAWKAFPADWDVIPEERFLSQETMAVIQSALETLPPGPRAVLTLRDIEGLSSEEVCSVLEVSETNQRVLLHRARSKVRRALERYFDES